MHAVTKKALIESVAERFASTYRSQNRWPTDRDYSKEMAIHAALKQLPATSDEEAVTAIIGHNRFTRNICHQCSADSDVTVAFGSEKHHMLDVKYLCLQCLEKAIRLASTSESATESA